MTKTTTVLLSTEKLIDLGSELTDIMNSLEMNNLTLEALEITQKVDTATFNWIAKKYIETAYAQNEKLCHVLRRSTRHHSFRRRATESVAGGGPGTGTHCPYPR